MAAARLREIILAEPAGSLLGSEDGLVSRLGASRSTVRQAARLLEYEGLLLVRRGINGGYYGTRPDLGTIETTVSAYLETLEMDSQDVTALASVLWVEVMRRAATLPKSETAPLVKEMRQKVEQLRQSVPFTVISTLERQFQHAIFGAANSRYIELIFQINTAFARRRFPVAEQRDDTDEHRIFVQQWKEAKRLELGAIENGDVELAAMAARHMRNIWHNRVWGNTG